MATKAKEYNVEAAVITALATAALIAIAACSDNKTDFGSMPADFLAAPSGTGQLPATFLAPPKEPVDDTTFIQQMLKETSWEELIPFRIGTAHAGNHNGGTDPRGNPTGETAGANGSRAGGYPNDGKVDFFIDRWVRTLFPDTSYGAFGGISASWLSSTTAKQQGFSAGFLSGVRSLSTPTGYVYNALTSYSDTGRYTGGGGFVAEHLSSAGQAARAGF